MSEMGNDDALWVMTALSAATLAACGGSGAIQRAAQGHQGDQRHGLPGHHGGQRGDTAATQDLLTGGIGKTGLGAAAALAYADPVNPRRPAAANALYSNYRGILDPSAGGGYGLL